MSFQGCAEVRCPNGCPPVEVPVWSFVRGDEESSLRESLLAGELNLILCEACGQVFYPEVPVVYVDGSAELVAFIFPESYRAEEERWRRKMAEDFGQMRAALGDRAPLAGEPLLFFGLEAVRGLLSLEQDLEDEIRIAEVLCRELGLSPRPVDRTAARRRGLPWMLPDAGRRPTLEGVRGGLDRLLKANDRLAGFARWREALDAGEALPALR